MSTPPPPPPLLPSQVGAWVPATCLRLHAVDAVHVRMGAQDHLEAGQSTFYVELAETAAMLRSATTRYSFQPHCLGVYSRPQLGGCVSLELR